jgi:hypothetical protein
MARSVVFIGERSFPQEPEQPVGRARGWWRDSVSGSSGPAALVNYSKVLLVAGLGLSQLVMGFASKDESGIVLSAAVMLASFLGSIGLFLGACVWGELRAWKERRP